MVLTDILIERKAGRQINISIDIDTKLDKSIDRKFDI